MDPPMSTQEQQLCHLLMTLPSRHKYRYSKSAQKDLLDGLFWSMARGKAENLSLFFPPGTDPSMKLSDAQGAVEGAEYTEAARGKPCGHIFKAGEASYACRTCSTDDTCVLCSRCFDSTDHRGHMVRINISVGNSGCCDCGDEEAWKVPMQCTIHSELAGPSGRDKGKQTSTVPEEIAQSIDMTVARVLDFICDVVSCCPEQLRQTKTKESIAKDEKMSRLSAESYGTEEPLEENIEYALLLWNDEKHTITDVQNHVARSCKTTEAQAYKRAIETDTVGRSILKYMDDVDTLLKMAKKLEEIRVTVTVRSSRDTFREQMCATMIDWLSDIAGCTVGNDNTLLRDVVCQELLRPWREGSSSAPTTGVGIGGIDDEARIAHEMEREQRFQRQVILNFQQLATQQPARLQVVQTLGQVDEIVQNNFMEGDSDDDDIDHILGFVEGEDDTPSIGEDDDDVMMVDARPDAAVATGVDWQRDEQAPLEENEATIADYPPPPPPPAGGPTRRAGRGERELTPSDSDTAERLQASSVLAKANADIPKTPGRPTKSKPSKPGRYWLEVPLGYGVRDDIPPEEDVFQRVRLDWLILFDLRMWKRVRNDLRSLYISTVVQVPRFKRVLGLRFASLYTILAQLYLVGDREPDHSIINLSLQMLTTPSITAELVERGNFLTSLLSILYTFLTTRQVGHPWDVNPRAVLAFDSGSVTNRRMYHFYMDLKYLFSSPHVQERIRLEHRYLLQFLDLVKLHQGIGPNTRAVGEHVEYETDSWITASLVTREINRMSRQLSDAFRKCPPAELGHLSLAIRATAKIVILNSIGADRERFKQAEIKSEVEFKTLQDFEFDTTDSKYRVVKFVVEKDPISFHHALHYTLSWLVECARSYTAEDIRSLLTFTTHELWAKPRSMGNKIMSRQEYTPEDYLMAAFDYPLRVCAWLAQIKANMWVRNGISLRHQAATYRGVNQRDVSHNRDIFLLQTAMVVCDPNRMLTAIIDRFGMDSWVKGIFEQKSEAQDDSQHLDVVEDMLHLLIVLLSDRAALIPQEYEPNQTLLAIRRDLVHVLCFKPLSFNEISNKMPDKYQEQEEFHEVLDEMTTFKAPEGVTDVGTFELKPEYIEEVDLYIAHYNKNQREEAETAYRKKIASRTGQAVDDVVYEPKLRPIPSGAFKDMPAFTSTGIFAQVVYYSLLYPLVATKLTPKVPSTRVETFLQVVLHLVLIAIAEDSTDDDAMTEESPASFVYIALTRPGRSNFIPEAPNAKTIVALLDLMSTKDEFKACHKKMALILKRMKQKRPTTFEQAYMALGIPVDRVNTASPAINTVEADRDRKKKAALSRQAKVMAQFQQQQKSFMENQGDIDWGAVSEGDEDEGEAVGAEERKNLWKYPSGTCILCQEETDDNRLSGTFALFNQSRIVRLTDLQDPDFVREAYHTPCNLDRSAEDIRPFGVAHENRTIVSKISQMGETIQEERQTVGKGFPASLSIPGTVSVGCGHLMHFSCFETYFEATQRRQAAQIARHHPENLKRNEFVCPLCKALGNAFLPVMWKPKEESHPGQVHVEDQQFAKFLDRELLLKYEYMDKTLRDMENVRSVFTSHATSTMASSIGDKALDLIRDVWVESPSSHTVTIGTGLGSQTIPIHDSNIRDSLANHPGMVGELAKAYQRLRETIRSNSLTANLEQRRWLADDAKHVGVLINVVGYTISSIEIQHRGVDNQPGMTLLDKIPEQLLTHLRILADTTQSYIMLGGLGSRGDYNPQRDFGADCERLHSQLFPAQAHGQSDLPDSSFSEVRLPLLGQDIFLFMCEITFNLVPVRKMDIFDVLRLCYLAELVKVVHNMSIHIPMEQWTDTLMSDDGSDRGLSMFAKFALQLTHWGISGSASGAMGRPVDKSAKNEAFNQPELQSLRGYCTFVRKYALTFLRKSAILLHVKYGLDISLAVPTDPDADELDRLSDLLRLPSFEHMCMSLSDLHASAGWPMSIQPVAKGWLLHHILRPQSLIGGDQAPTSAVLTHPGIFELVGLPKNFDALIEESTRRRCPTTGKDLSDPMICLLCGEMFCGQSVCCLKQQRFPGETERESIGGAQQHMRKCQENVGLFLNIRKCCTFYLFRRSGSWSAAPYIDRYGETDMGLRHSRQLFLHQKRYDTTLRATFLAHGIPSFISRKLEGEINNGGWETI